VNQKKNVMEKQVVGITLAQWIKAKGGSLQTNITSECINIVCVLGAVKLNYSGMFDLKALRSLERVFETVTGKTVVATSTSEVGITARWIMEQYKVDLVSGLDILDKLVRKQRDGADADGFLPIVGEESVITFAQYLDGEQGDFIRAEGAQLAKYAKYLTVEGVQHEVEQGGIRLGKRKDNSRLDSFAELVEVWGTMPYETKEVKVVREAQVADNIEDAVAILNEFLSHDLNMMTGTERKTLFWGGGAEVSKNKRGTFAQNFPSRVRLSVREFIIQTVENARRHWGLDEIVRAHGAKNNYAFVVGMILRAKGQFSVEAEGIMFVPVFNEKK